MSAKDNHGIGKSDPLGARRIAADYEGVRAISALCGGTRPGALSG
ncbi:hypothetical protein ATL40_0655 [Serinibacter salmoneus]|uniref:Uncharacterized protein n=1 Tax=Serinibacter salmoneus TaxID=556530 RepID=A0A2A9CZS6_9MICO|nr:hypothetical protein ATL40_0655 [Serinibacter salmoneus]